MQMYSTRVSVMVAEVPEHPTTLRLSWLQRNGSFIRLKNMEIGYTLPKSLTSKTFIKSFRFYVSGSNLLTFAPFDMWDPEKGGGEGSGYPLNRVITIGFNANF